MGDRKSSDEPSLFDLPLRGRPEAAPEDDAERARRRAEEPPAPGREPEEERPFWETEEASEEAPETSPYAETEAAEATEDPPAVRGADLDRGFDTASHSDPDADPALFDTNPRAASEAAPPAHHQTGPSRPPRSGADAWDEMEAAPAPASADEPDSYDEPRPGAAVGGLGGARSALHEEPVPATWVQRLAASLLDGGLLLVVTATAIFGASLLGVSWDAEDLPPLGMFLLVFSFVYSVMPLAFWGRTPGMALTRLLSRGADGGPLTFGQTALRWLGGLLTVALAGLPLLLALPALGGRSLADRLSGTHTWLRPGA